jgi:hypothetical protein
MAAERLFRCDTCGWRGWLMPLVNIEGEPADLVEAPDLGSLDKTVWSLPAPAPRSRRNFSPRDLQ